jgi:hypothetical protein
MRSERGRCLCILHLSLLYSNCVHDSKSVMPCSVSRERPLRLPGSVQCGVTLVKSERMRSCK